MRGADEKRLEAICQTVGQKPGIKPGRVAAQLDIPRSSVIRALPMMAKLLDLATTGFVAALCYNEARKPSWEDSQ